MSKIRTLTLSIFPEMGTHKASLINLDARAAQIIPREGRSPFLNPALTDRFLLAVNREQGVDFTLGGYLEDRSTVWRGSYLAHDNAVHLAIDVNVRAGTALGVKYPSVVEKIIHDPDQNGGWGSVIMFALKQPVGNISHYLYAHLARQTIAVKEGQEVQPGEIVGYIGVPEENGGWYEHLHVQAFTPKCWVESGADLKNFDGYGTAVSTSEHPRFPNPMPLLV